MKIRDKQSSPAVTRGHFGKGMIQIPDVAQHQGRYSRVKQRIAKW